jgi:hypothetical protein
MRQGPEPEQLLTTRCPASASTGWAGSASNAQTAAPVAPGSTRTRSGGILSAIDEMPRSLGNSMESVAILSLASQ